jgi:hypothetical protein
MVKVASIAPTITFMIHRLIVGITARQCKVDERKHAGSAGRLKHFLTAPGFCEVDMVTHGGTSVGDLDQTADGALRAPGETVKRRGARESFSPIRSDDFRHIRRPRDDCITQFL